MNLSNRIKAVEPSLTLAITALAAQLKSEGKDIIGFGAGEPDFDTPEHIKQAGIKAITDGLTRYTAVNGILELRQAIKGKLARDNGLKFDENQILVSVGAKQAIFNLLQAAINPGDEVIIPAPYWVSYPDMVKLAEGVPVILPCHMDQAFKLSAEKLEASITSKTRMIFLNSPSNPTGAVYSKAELKALAEVLKKHPNIIIASDDIYEHIYWGKEKFCNILMACPDLENQTVLFNGVSKAYAMTGWRIGYAAGPLGIINAMKKMQGQSTSNATSISQVAAVAALNGDHQCVADMVKAFKERHDYIVETLNNINGVACLPADGAFYAFPSVVSALTQLKHIKDDLELCEILINEAGIALVPGTAFGAPGHVRFSFATSMKNLEVGLNRFKNFIDSK